MTKITEEDKPWLDQIWEESQVQLEALYKAYQSYMYLETTDLIDLVLAVAISRLQKGEKLWFIIISRSSDGKTELVKCLEHDEISKVIKAFTPNTLVNGFVDPVKNPDLAPKLKDKVVLIPEMASILKLHPNDKAQVWAQLRDLYDGTAGKQSGMGADKIYKDLNVSLIGCSTPAIDNQVLIHQDLGTRELLYRMREKDNHKLMAKVVENNNNDDKEKAREVFKELVKKFLDNHRYENNPILEEVQSRIQNYALSLTKLRATAEVDHYTGELNNMVYPESPARLLGQLMVLFKSLKSLDKDYSDEKAMKIIKDVVLSSCSEIRMNVLKMLLLHNDEWLGRKKIANKLKIGIKTVFKELNILTALDLIVFDEDELDTVNGKRFAKKWRVDNDNPVIQFLAGEFGIGLNRSIEEEVVH